MQKLSRFVFLPLLLWLSLGWSAISQDASSGAHSRQNEGAIHGVVTTAGGKPLAKAKVTLTSLSTEDTMSTKTDKQGRFQFLQLYGGKFKLEVTSDHGETANEEFTLGSNEKVIRNLIANAPR
jgi:Carboxypeptidase regulatory-like domain